MVLKQAISESDLQKNNFITRKILFISSLLLFLLFLVGNLMKLNTPGTACTISFFCGGEGLPGILSNSGSDWLYIILSVTSFISLVYLLYMLFGKKETNNIIYNSVLISVILMVFQVTLGFYVLIIRTGMSLSPIFSILHQLISLLTLGFVLMALTVSSYRLEAAHRKLKFRTSYARLGFSGLGLLLLIAFTGAWISFLNTTNACSGWPICNPVSWIGWLVLSHRILVALAAITIGMLVFLAWRNNRSSPVIMVAATTAGVLFISQALLGKNLLNNFPTYLVVIHQATSIAVWISMVVLVVSTGIENRTREMEFADFEAIKGRKAVTLMKDLLALTKPVVVLLLLVTTFAGMVIGLRAFPPLDKVFFTLLAGFMAAGGSGAINQYIDRFDDQKMQRTQKRPIPSGRLTPGEGLAFGVAMSLGAFYLMVATVNLIAALLTLAGIFYYVLLYSLILKKTTVQNIVIGGGAGAIPPLVGWAAATGSLNIPSIFLFAVIFMWTPPHFWALALVRRNDYARAGVPMLPVVRGEVETRWQIMIYTIALVILTVLLPVFGLGGAIYLVGAILLGLWLVSAAYRMWKQGGNKLAWKMYRYSSMYLAFIFLILMVDRLL